ncbi:MAG: hypothetical protein ACE5H1_09625, partial [Thermodesulfobacteriota bacterium]
NHLYVFLYKKAEKLSSALYMVTNFVSENETLRSLLRDKSINVFSEIAHLQKLSLTGHKSLRTNDSIKSRYNSLQTILSGITEIISFLEILHSSGLISEMNFMILRREYIELGTLIKNRKDDIATGDMHLEKDFLDVPDLYRTYSLRQGATNKTKSIKDTVDQVKDITKDIKKSQIGPRPISPGLKISPRITKTANIKHSDRRNIILELLQNKSFITIKDTADAIKGCSTKTLQRELLSLVSEGILKKKGERRWSTYSLV